MLTPVPYGAYTSRNVCWVGTAELSVKPTANPHRSRFGDRDNALLLHQVFGQGLGVLQIRDPQMLLDLAGALR